MEQARRFPIEGVPNVPFAGIDQTWDSPSQRLELRVYLGEDVEPRTRRLLIRFDRPLAFRHGDEKFGLDPLPDPVPRLDPPNHRWTFPSLVVDGSTWAKSYADFGCEQPWHLVFISYEEVFHVLCTAAPTISWEPFVEA
jgi:hypothetical protein